MAGTASERTAAADPRVRIVDPSETSDGVVEVSIVVVTYGTDEVVLDLLESVAANTSLPHEVIVVDNPVSDRAATRELLRATTSGVVMVLPEENLGFGGGCDLGAARARGRLLCFLNPDVVVGEGWLEPLVAALDDPDVAVAAPPLLDPDGTVQEAGQVVLADGCTMAVGGPELLSGRAQLFDRDVDYASAACWVLRRVDHLGRGGFDERYHPAYFEDADYGMRLEAEGLVTRLVTARPVVHRRGGGGAGRSLEIPEASREVLRRVHTDELARRLPRPAAGDLAAALSLRDRRAERRVVRVAPQTADPGALRDAFAAAVAHARREPRNRVTFVTAERGPLTEAELAGARTAGLEVVIGDVAAEVAARRSIGAVVVDVDASELGTGEIAAMTGPERAGRSPFHVRPSTVAAIAFVALAGVLARRVVLRSPSGRLNSDEAYLGIEAFEVLVGRFPIVLGGTVYTAVFEAYLFAPWVAVVGAGILPLKLVAMTFWAIASLVIAAIAHRIVSLDESVRSGRAARLAALAAGTAAWVTPGALLTVSTNAYASYASGMAVTATAFLVAHRLVDHPDPGRRLPLMLGVLAGAGFWMHPMFLSTLVPMLAVVVIRHRRSARVWIWTTIGGLIGCGPLLIWNAANAWPSLTSPVEVEGSYTERLSTFLRDLVPRAFGLRDGRLEWMLGPVLGPLLYVALLGAALGGAIVAFRSTTRPSRFLLPAVLAGVFPIMALFPPLIFANDGRYGIVSFPFLVVALAVASTWLARWSSRFAERTGGSVIVVAGVLLWLGAFVGPHLQLLLDGTDGDPNAPVHEVVDRLRAADIAHVYGSYWRVLPVEFVGDRAITGGVLAPFPVRFPERQAEVEAVGAATPERVAFVFQPSDEDPSRLWLPVGEYRREVVGDTVLYLPVAAVPAAPG